MQNRRVEDFRTKFQNVALTAEKVLIFLRILRHLGGDRKKCNGPSKSFEKD